VACSWMSCVGCSVARNRSSIPKQIDNTSCASCEYPALDRDVPVSSGGEVDSSCYPAGMGGCSVASWTQERTPWDSAIPRSGVRGRGCRTSTECEEKGWCAGHLPSECYEATAESCGKYFYCRYEGLCRLSDGICVVADESDCNNSTVCKESGQCSLGVGRCIATSDSQCRASRNCSNFGLCTRLDEICVAGDSTDCRQSRICKLYGRCHAVDGGCFALSTADCDSGCKTTGRCHWEKGTCVAKSDTDCIESQWCKSFHKCAVLDGECEFGWIVEGRRIHPDYEDI